MRLSTETQFRALAKIADAITADPERYTDGECLDEVWKILESIGFSMGRINRLKEIRRNK